MSDENTLWLTARDEHGVAIVTARIVRWGAGIRVTLGKATLDVTAPALYRALGLVATREAEGE